MSVEFITIRNIKVPIFVPDNLPDLPEGRRVDQKEEESNCEENKLTKSKEVV